MPADQSGPPPFQVKAERVRCVVHCGECSKPRCIYSVKKLTLQEDQPKVEDGRQLSVDPSSVFRRLKTVLN